MIHTSDLNKGVNQMQTTYTTLAPNMPNDAQRINLIKQMVLVNMEEESTLTFDKEPSNPFLKLVKGNK
jgi:hypothetical protein